MSSKFDRKRHIFLQNQTGQEIEWRLIELYFALVYVNGRFIQVINWNPQRIFSRIIQGAHAALAFMFQNNNYRRTVKSRRKKNSTKIA